MTRNSVAEAHLQSNRQQINYENLLEEMGNGKLGDSISKCRITSIEQTTTKETHKDERCAQDQIGDPCTKLRTKSVEQHPSPTNVEYEQILSECAKLRDLCQRLKEENESLKMSNRMLQSNYDILEKRLELDANQILHKSLHSLSTNKRRHSKAFGNEEDSSPTGVISYSGPLEVESDSDLSSCSASENDTNKMEEFDWTDDSDNDMSGPEEDDPTDSDDDVVFIPNDESELIIIDSSDSSNDESDSSGSDSLCVDYPESRRWTFLKPIDQYLAVKQPSTICENLTPKQLETVENNPPSLNHHRRRSATTTSPACAAPNSRDRIPDSTEKPHGGEAILETPNPSPPRTVITVAEIHAAPRHCKHKLSTVEKKQTEATERSDGMSLSVLNENGPITQSDDKPFTEKDDLAQWVEEPKERYAYSDISKETDASSRRTSASASDDQMDPSQWSFIDLVDSSYDERIDCSNDSSESNSLSDDEPQTVEWSFLKPLAQYSNLGKYAAISQN